MWRKTKRGLLAALIGTGGLGLLAAPMAHAQELQLELTVPDASAGAADDIDVEVNEDFEELTAGPVHEGYSAPVANPSLDPLVIPKQPPEPITEEPPPQELDAKNVVWLPGYWGWDPMREDFVWVSGLWRISPPGRNWVPGYWTEAQTGEGYIWVAGFWTDAQQETVNYLPYPPETLEAGPTSEQPSDNHFWIPGQWNYRSNDYAWQPGYWSHVQENWVWMPSQYYSTPSGCIYEPGYWDYTMPRRGILFAPVYFNRPVYLDSGYYYRPRLVINTLRLGYYLFSRPAYNHYYFGGYYGDRYTNLGIYPWYSTQHRHRGYYDPFNSYYNWYYGRNNGNWRNHFNDRYDRYASGDLRLPRNYSEQRDMYRDGRGGRGGRDNFPMVTTMDRYSRQANWKLQNVSRDRQRDYRDLNTSMRDFQNERRRSELDRVVSRDGRPGDGRPGGRTDRDGPQLGGPDGDRAGRPGGRNDNFKPGDLKLPNQTYARMREINRGGRGPDAAGNRTGGNRTGAGNRPGEQSPADRVNELTNRRDRDGRTGRPNTLPGTVGRDNVSGTRPGNRPGTRPGNNDAAEALRSRDGRLPSNTLDPRRNAGNLNRDVDALRRQQRLETQGPESLRSGADRARANRTPSADPNINRVNPNRGNFNRENTGQVDRSRTRSDGFSQQLQQQQSRERARQRSGAVPDSTRQLNPGGNPATRDFNRNRGSVTPRSAPADVARPSRNFNSGTSRGAARMPVPDRAPQIRSMPAPDRGGSNMRSRSGGGGGNPAMRAPSGGGGGGSPAMRAPGGGGGGGRSRGGPGPSAPRIQSGGGGGGNQPAMRGNSGGGNRGGGDRSGDRSGGGGGGGRGRGRGND